MKDALAKSIERETELENALTLSEDSRVRLEEALAKSIERVKELEARLGHSAAVEIEFRAVEKKLSESVKREALLEQKLAASLARERRLTSYVGNLSKMYAEAESILEDIRNFGQDVTSPVFEDLMHIMSQGQENTSSEVCCQNFEECHNQCVPRAEHWKWRAKEAEKKVKAYQWHMQWTIPDVTCNAEPVKPAEPKPSGPPNRPRPLI